MMSNSLMKETFNLICYQIISYLESLKHVVDINFKAEKGSSAQEITDWDKANHPYQSSKDMKWFYELFNGVCLTWAVQGAGKKIPNIGCIRMKPLKEMTRIPLDGLDSTRLEGSKDYQGQEQSGRSKEEAASSSSSISKTTKTSCSFAAFLLESSARFGKVAIVFRSSDSSWIASNNLDLHNEADGCRGVWLQDLSNEWHFICATFTDYVRLITVHLGIQGWQKAYSKAGLDPVTKQWMRLYCPERLVIDEKQHVATRSSSDGSKEG